MKKYFVIILLLVCNLLGAQPKQTILEEDYYSNIYAWDEQNKEDLISRVESGKYYIEHKRIKRTYLSSIKSDLYYGDDFFIETTIGWEKGDQKTGYGIVWGKGDTGYYIFIISPNGKFLVRKISKTSRSKNLISWRNSESIKKGKTEKNVLRVQKQDEELVFFINNEHVADCKFESFFGNELGLCIYGYQILNVYSFGVYGTSIKGMQAKKREELNILRFGVNDDKSKKGIKFGNGNNKIEPNETVEITALLKNVGDGDADDIYAKMNLLTDDENVTFPGENKKFRIGRLKAGDAKKFTFFFSTNALFTGKELIFQVLLLDNSKKYRTTEKILIPIKMRLPNYKTFENQSNNNQQAFTNIANDIPVCRYDGSNTYAILIGIEDYMELPDARYALNDISAVRQYLLKMMNVPDKNILSLSNSDANYYNLSELFSSFGWLSDQKMNSRSTLIIYYSGLGMPLPDTYKALLLPYNASAKTFENTILLDDFYLQLSKLNYGSCFVFIDACFSGINRDKQPFIAKGGTLFNIPVFPKTAQKKLAICYASYGEQANIYLEDYKLGLFTYAILKNLHLYGLKNSSATINELFNKSTPIILKESINRKLNILPKLEGGGVHNYILK